MALRKVMFVQASSHLSGCSLDPISEKKNNCALHSFLSSLVIGNGLERNADVNVVHE